MLHLSFFIMFLSAGLPSLSDSVSPRETFLLRRTPPRISEDPQYAGRVEGHKFLQPASPFAELGSPFRDQPQRSSASQPGDSMSGERKRKQYIAPSEPRLNHPTKWPSNELGLDPHLHHLIRPSTYPRSNMGASIQAKDAEKYHEDISKSQPKPKQARKQ